MRGSLFTCFFVLGCNFYYCIFSFLLHIPIEQLFSVPMKMLLCGSPFTLDSANATRLNIRLGQLLKVEHVMLMANFCRCQARHCIECEKNLLGANGACCPPYVGPSERSARYPWLLLLLPGTSWLLLPLLRFPLDASSRRIWLYR